MDCQEWIPVQYFKMAFYICLAIYTLVAYSVFSSTLQKTPKDKKASIVIHGRVDKVLQFVSFECREIFHVCFSPVALK